MSVILYPNVRKIEGKSLKSIEKKLLWNRLSLCLSLIFLTISIIINTVKAQAPVDPSSIIGKVVCGYQGWFTCAGDGSPITQWTHWAPGTAPQAGVAPNPNPNLTFDVYPDVSMYQPTSLFQTNFADLGDGQPSKLFSDYHQDVTDKHFELMQANGIDGVAFQRFIWEVLVDPRFKANRDTDEVHVRAAAEKYQRMFYLVYDLSGLGNVPATSDQVRLDSVQGDWQNNMIAKLHITSSPMYAKQGGKPVVQIWGIGYSHIIGTAAQQTALINWFKAQGCYVIIGVPIDWHKLGNTGSPGGVPAKAGWTSTYLAGNMVSPWAVGAYSDVTTTNNYKTSYLTPDLSYCTTNGMDYQPVIFPGFSWYNWNSGTQNQIPRNKGNFLWLQAENLRALNIKTAEIAMMDEYDEGTAILPMADSYFEIPTNQYFVTSSADGTYVSSDFYIRLANKVTRQINQLDAVNPVMPVPLSLGPMYFRTGNEALYDAQPSFVSTVDVPLTNIKQYTGNPGTVPTCVAIAENPHVGSYSLKIMGHDNSAGTSSVYFKVYTVSIPVTITTDLSFWTYPLNALGKFISVDLDMSDGTTLRSTAAVDYNNVSMKPSTGRGIVNTWTQTKCNIGQWLNGKTISKITVGYDNNPLTGDFSGYIDDIAINEESFSVLPLKIVSFSAEPLKNDVLVKWQAAQESELKQYEIERSTDGVHFSNIHTQAAYYGALVNNYTYTDANVSADVSDKTTFYYRLKATDLDGNISYSKVEMISFKNKAAFVNTVFPNPFTDKVELSINAASDEVMAATITNTSGRNVVDSRMKISKGTSKVTLGNLDRLSKGIYFLKLTLEDKTETFKIEK